ncbi:MAG TPA: hypothetical protein VLJ57_10625 [Burkholderiaceae bacterium]|nr:hypothetical protein [Burkholderiaceae bacterium]
MKNFQIPLSSPIYGPFSGDVTQAINPWSWAIKTVGGQFGLININLGASRDPALEQQILDEVGSYGRQLGQIGDALAVVLEHVDLGRLDVKEKRAITALRSQLDQIERLKEKRAQK